MTSQRVHWHRELLEHPLPPLFDKLIIYCTVPCSILTIHAKGLIDLHLNIIKGLNKICLCNSFNSPARILRFLTNPSIFCRFHDQKMEIFFDPQYPSSTLLVVIRKKNELITLYEESKIGFLKNRIFCISRKALKTYPCPIRELYLKPNILKAVFQTIRGGFAYRGQYSNKCLELRNCINNCANSCDSTISSSSPYYYGMFVYTNHLDWYHNYYLNARCHERSGPIFRR